MIYNPRIKNPEKKKVEGNFYTLSLPTTILDLMIHTKSFAQEAQQNLARRFAENYEFAQSLLRPVKETIRFFFVHPGGTQWVLDNGRNLRVCCCGIAANRSASSISMITTFGWLIISKTLLKSMGWIHGVVLMV
jgi:hypothetical protein